MIACCKLCLPDLRSCPCTGSWGVCKEKPVVTTVILQQPPLFHYRQTIESTPGSKRKEIWERVRLAGSATFGTHLLFFPHYPLLHAQPFTHPLLLPPSTTRHGRSRRDHRNSVSPLRLPLYMFTDPARSVDERISTTIHAPKKGGFNSS